MTPKTRGTFLVLVCAALWALIPVVAKLGQTSLDHHQFLFWSSLVSFLVLSLTTLHKGTFRAITELQILHWLQIICLGLLGTYIYYLFLYLGYARATGMEVLVIQYTWPLLIILFSIILLGEKLNQRKIIAVSLGFFGVVIVLSKGDFSQINVSNPLVITLVATGAACFALFSVLSKLMRQEPLMLISLYFLTALIASFLSMFYFSSFALPGTADWVPVLLNGILVNGYSYLLWIQALRSTEASYLAPFTFITPILSAVYLVVFFDEPLHPAFAIGLLCVVGAGLINSRGSMARAR